MSEIIQVTVMFPPQQITAVVVRDVGPQGADGPQGVQGETGPPGEIPEGVELKAEKGLPNGYAPLDFTGKIPQDFIPPDITNLDGGTLV